MRTAMDMIGAIVCKWKGSHTWRRVPIKKGGGDQYYHPAHSLCTRCGLTRPIKPRERKPKLTPEQLRERMCGVTDMMRGTTNADGVQTGVYETTVTRDGAVVK